MITALAVLLVIYEVVSTLAYWYATGKEWTIKPSVGGAIFTTILNCAFIFYVLVTV